jgi:hypothetical protein
MAVITNFIAPQPYPALVAVRSGEGDGVGLVLLSIDLKPNELAYFGKGYGCRKVFPSALCFQLVGAPKSLDLTNPLFGTF